MYDKFFIIVLCLLVKNEICRGEEDCDLNLSQIFRTPKDFSKVNFDHLEVLERNNFDSSSEQPSTNSVQNEICKPSESFPKSIANAQVMLRFGGDDIRGHNRLESGGRLIVSPNCHHPHPRHFCRLPNNDVRYSPYPPCAPLPFAPEYSASLPMSEYYYPYPPPPPYVFPGCYYRLSPEFRNPHYYGLPHRPIDVTGRKTADCIHRHQRRSNPNEMDFSEVRTGRIENRNHPQILQADDLSDDIIQKTNDTEVPNIEPLPENIEQAEIVEKEVKANELPTDKVNSNELPTEKVNSNELPTEIVEDTSNTKLIEDNVQAEINFKDGNTHKVELIEKDVQVTETPSDLNSDVKFLNKNDSSNNTEAILPTMAEITLDKVESQPGCSVSSSSEVEIDLNRKPSPEMEAWLNNSLVTYSCKNCDDQRPRLLVSYPVENSTNDIRPILTTDEGVKGCCCREKYGVCNCGKCDRNPDIPYGQRFMVDIDSLAGLRNIEETLPSPEMYSTGFKSSSQSSLYSSYSKVGNERPNIYLDGYRKHSGASYYSDPTKVVYYREPTVISFINKPDPTEPVITHTKVEMPHIYKVIPKYQIVPVNITPLDVPDLVQTNRFICPFCKCHRSSYTNRYYPIDNHQINYHQGGYYPNDYHHRDFLRRVESYSPSCRQTYCPYCAPYRRYFQKTYKPMPLLQEEHIPVRREYVIPHDDFLEYHTVSKDIP